MSLSSSKRVMAGAWSYELKSQLPDNIESAMNGPPVAASVITAQFSLGMLNSWNRLTQTRVAPFFILIASVETWKSLPFDYQVLSSQVLTIILIVFICVNKGTYECSCPWSLSTCQIPLSYRQLCSV